MDIENGKAGGTSLAPDGGEIVAPQAAPSTPARLSPKGNPALGTQTALACGDAETETAPGQSSAKRLRNVAPAEHMSPHAMSPNTEQLLRQQLLASRTLIDRLSADNEELRQALQQERSFMSDLQDSLRAHSEYSHQVSRLVRVFRALNVTVPALDKPNFDVDWLADEVREKVAQSYQPKVVKPEPVDGEKKTFLMSSMECLKMLLGAEDIQPGENPSSLKFFLKNDILGRKMTCLLEWTPNSVGYQCLSTTSIPEASKPSFLNNKSIDFDKQQAPNFLLHILNCLHV